MLASAATYGVAQVATGLDSGLLRSLFGVFLILIALRMLAGSRKAGSADGAGYFNRKWLPLVGIPGGACMGLLGVGGGLLATPIFTQAFGQRPLPAQAGGVLQVAAVDGIAQAVFAEGLRVLQGLAVDAEHQRRRLVGGQTNRQCSYSCEIKLRDDKESNVEQHLLLLLGGQP